MSAPPLRIAHISDPHFGTVVDSVRAALLQALHAAPPDLIIVTGDITQRARGEQFRLAAAFFGELPDVPRVCLPGNHDLPLFDVFTRFVRPYARYRRYILRNLEPEFVDDRIAVLCVDATRRTRHVDGDLRNGHIDRVAARLASVRRPFRLIAMHQPLVVPTGSERHNVAHGAKRALQQWLRAGADAFLGGHIHLPYCQEATIGDAQEPGEPPHRPAAGAEAAVQSARRPDAQATGLIIQAGTCLSHRVRSGIPNSYNALTLDGAGAQRRMTIERRDFDVVKGSFATALRYDAIDESSGARGTSRWRLSCVTS